MKDYGYMSEYVEHDSIVQEEAVWSWWMLLAVQDVDGWSTWKPERPDAGKGGRCQDAPVFLPLKAPVRIFGACVNRAFHHA